MSNLAPGKTYIYERANGIIYARGIGETDRTIIGYDTDHTAQHQRLISKWNEILRLSESDPALKEMINQIEVYYTLKNTP
jgi:hypothetical protein